MEEARIGFCPRRLARRLGQPVRFPERLGSLAKSGNETRGSGDSDGRANSRPGVGSASLVGPLRPCRPESEPGRRWSLGRSLPRGEGSLRPCDRAHRRQREADPPPGLSQWLVPVCKPRPGGVGGGTLEIAVVLGRRLSVAQLSLAPNFASGGRGGLPFSRARAAAWSRGQCRRAGTPTKPVTLFREGL